MGWKRAYELIKEQDYQTLSRHMVGETDPEATIWKACYHLAIERGDASPEKVQELCEKTLKKMSEVK